MINRRNFLEHAVHAGAALALAPQLLRAAPTTSAALIQRAIPSTGEMLPVVGLSFSNHSTCTDNAVLTEVLSVFAANGGRVFDAMHVSVPEAERFHVDAARGLGVQQRLFWSMRGTFGGSSGESAGVHEYVDSLLTRLAIPRLDLAMLPARDDRALLTALQREKKSGRVRYVGVQVISDNFYAPLETIMRNEPIDFIGIDYDIGNRARVEETILPLALERKIGVMAFFPFGNNGGVSCGAGANLFGRVGSRPLPEWAAEFDATSWAQFFLKYVISHPAITVARIGTSKVPHLVDNMRGGVGRLPDAATRKRMAALIDALPPVTVAPRVRTLESADALVLSPATLDRYVGKYRTSGGQVIDVRRYGSIVVVKVAAGSESVARPLSATRFAFEAGTIEFQIDAADVVTGFRYVQGDRVVPATRIR